MIASITVPIKAIGVEVEVTVIPIQRGLGATIDYGVVCWSVSGKYRKVIVGGEQMCPPEIIADAKLKLWESIKP